LIIEIFIDEVMKTYIPSEQLSLII